MFGTKPFFPLLDGQFVPPTKSLETLTGEVIGRAPTPMIQRVKAAWTTPVSDLSCEQIRLLVSQKMGLRHLAEPVAVFVKKYPDVEVTFYPGDLSAMALEAFPDLLEFAPKAAREMASADFAQVIRDMMEYDPQSAEKVKQGIQEALALSRGHS